MIVKLRVDNVLRIHRAGHPSQGRSLKQGALFSTRHASLRIALIDPSKDKIYDGRR